MAHRPTAPRTVRVFGGGPDVLGRAGLLFSSVVAGGLTAYALCPRFGAGAPLSPAEALFAAAALVLYPAVAVCSLVLALPRALARREVVVGAAGVEAVESPKWWFQGRRALIPWDAIAEVRAETVRVRDRDGPARYSDRPVLDLYLRRGVSGLPRFARCANAGRLREGRDAPAALYTRIGGRGLLMELSVRRIGEAIAEERPDLFQVTEYPHWP